VKLGDNSRMIVVGKGSVKIKVGGIIQVISDMYFIPELKNNLLSIGQLQEKGLTIVFKEDLQSVSSRQGCDYAIQNVSKSYVCHNGNYGLTYLL
jgi:hypothetical protein